MSHSILKNRIIKFRIWEFIPQKFFYIDLKNIDRDHFIGAAIKNKKNYYQQYIGLKDANNKDIYEGDILDIHGLRFICEYDYLKFQFRCMRDREYVISINSDHDTNICHVAKIIGNIFENPELIK